MKAVQIGSPDYAARIRRAHYLASEHPFAAEVLNFYQQLAAFQQKFHSRISRSDSGRGAASLRPNSAGSFAKPSDPALRPNSAALFAEPPNLPLLLPDFPELLALLQIAGPTPVRESARRLSQQSATQWQALLANFWTAQPQQAPSSDVQKNRDESSDPLTDFVLRAFLHPYAEFLASRMPVPQLTANDRVCPRCGSLPLLGVLRPEADGGKRFLMCSFCLQEWEFRRIFCAACAEDDEKKLPVYVAEQFPHIRVEACDTCKFYLRTIDLTKNGHAIPLVDDLAALPLSLWAHEHAFTRIHDNLLGT
jgi:formate dehydrogenase maturation protein FdhE